MAPKIGINTIVKRASFRKADPRSVYVCFQCQRKASTQSLKAKPSFPSCPIPRRLASTSPFSERLRKKIWGTDTPPGQEDPYGPPGVVEQNRKDRELGDHQQTFPDPESRSKSQSAVDEEDDSGLLESDATTWEGMPVVGGHGWGMREWDAEHPYTGFDYRININQQ